MSALEPYNVYNQGLSFPFKSVAVIGDNSAGKSTIYNTYLGLQLEVGVDDTTQEV